MQKNKKYQWYKVAAGRWEVMQRGGPLVLEVNVAGRDICIFFSGENLFATTAKCPHAGGRLSGGFIDSNNNIVCPLHGYRFKLKNGVNCSGEGYHLKTFEIKENEEGIFVGIEILS